MFKEEDIVLLASHYNGVYILDFVTPATVDEFTHNSNQVFIDKLNLNSIPCTNLTRTDEIMSENSGDLNSTSNNPDLHYF